LKIKKLIRASGDWFLPYELSDGLGVIPNKIRARIDFIKYIGCGGRI